MKRVKEEAEVIVRIDYQEKLAHICVSAWPSMAARMEKRYGVSKDGRSTPRAARWTVPLRCIRFGSLEKRKGPTGAILTQRHRQQRNPDTV